MWKVKTLVVVVLSTTTVSGKKYTYDDTTASIISDYNAMKSSCSSGQSGHTYRLTDTQDYETDSDGTSRQPFYQWANGFNSYRCLHNSMDVDNVTGSQNVLRWRYALAESALTYLQTSATVFSENQKYVVHNGIEYLIADDLGSDAESIAEVVKSWYETNTNCDIAVDQPGCINSDGTGSSTQPQAENVYAFVRLMWGNMGDFGCACHNSKIACLLEVMPQLTTPVSTACDNITHATCHEETNLTYTYDSDCYVVGEDGDSRCTISMLPAQDAITISKFSTAQANCYQTQTESMWQTISAQIAETQTINTDTQDLHWSIYLLIVLSALVVIGGIVAAVVYRAKLTHIVHRYRLTKKWIKQESSALRAMNARLHSSLAPADERTPDPNHIMSKPHQHPHVGIVRGQKPRGAIKRNAEACMSPAAIFFAKKRVGEWRNKARSRQSGDAELIQRRPPKSDMGEVEL